MLAQVDSCAVLGIDSYIVRCEVDITTMIAFFAIVGLPDAAVNEARERVRSAIKNTGLEFPNKRVCVNLAPADIQKRGPSFDLPIAVGMLAATRQVPDTHLADWLFIGELALDGSVRPVSGVLPMAIKAKQDGRKGMIVPADNAEEAAIVGEINVYPVRNLAEVVMLLCDDAEAPIPVTADPIALLARDIEDSVDLNEVKGQAHVKRALEVAAAGGHNILMVGPPGSGKSMLARRVPTILAPLTLDESLESTKIYSVSGHLAAINGISGAGMPGGGISLIAKRPFRAPHHTISNAGLTGGGTVPRPGEVSLAHNGVLFLDELPEFKRDVLEVMRQPLEDGFVTVVRVAAALTYPARFMLVAAMNPCPCGYYGDHLKACTCTPPQIKQYLQRISGPLLDRIDIHIEVPRVKQDEMTNSGDSGEPSKCIRNRVVQARNIQQARFDGTTLHCNAHMQAKQIRAHCKLSQDVKDLLRAAITQLSLSARAYDRILKLSRTIADLDERENIELAHVAEALQYRALDRKMWG
jgi:magnesium chelatase family protein